MSNAYYRRLMCSLSIFLGGISLLEMTTDFLPTKVFLPVALPCACVLLGSIIYDVIIMRKNIRANRREESSQEHLERLARERIAERTALGRRHSHRVPPMPHRLPSVLHEEVRRFKEEFGVEPEEKYEVPKVRKIRE